MQQAFDVIVIGAGIAGVSAAAQLSSYCKVLVLERESAAGYHATGRSAAAFAPAYGNEVVRNLTAAAEKFYTQPPEGFSEYALLTPRDSVFIANHNQQSVLSSMLIESSHLASLTSAELVTRVPILNSAKLQGGAIDTTSGDLDVDAILQGFLRRFRNNGGQLVFNREVLQLARKNAVWQVSCDDGIFTAPTVVNAAGAWADHIATLAGANAVSVIPYRRSALLVDAPAEMDIKDWPLIIDAEENFYFKPEAGQLLISPADETESEACDAFPDDIDLAVAIDKVQSISHLEVSKINHSWAGLRTFAKDKTFVLGFDPTLSGFFWLAGQGGYGVQSAPTLADITCHLICGSNDIITDFCRDMHLSDISPERFQ
ncbi:MAG: D-arginine dehydrogenase [Candidatus Azotimanducaceae bacterium]|jgi:D-arginine dehydrogenase